MPYEVKIGFTGTRRGLTAPQMDRVCDILHFFSASAVNAKRFNHGSCVGADEQAAVIAQEMGYHVVAYPSTLTLQSKFVSDHRMLPAHPLDRNTRIIADSNYMIACPRNFVIPDSLRGEGTWWTIDQIDRWRSPRVIVYPDGTLNEKWRRSHLWLQFLLGMKVGIVP